MRFCVLTTLHIGGVTVKSKKVLSALISFTMLLLICCSPFVSYASFFVSDGDIDSCPGNTRVYTEPEKYNYAWLDSVILRDDTLAVTPLTVYPLSEYPYRVTCEEFVKECNSYMKLFEASDTVVQQTVIDSLKTVYYTLVSTGKITDSNQDMRAYNESCGIVYPYTESKFTDIYTLITYACLNTDLYKLVSDKSVNITRGTTIEGAVVRYLSVVCGMDLPESVDTIPAFSYMFSKEYIVDDTMYPVSENPSEEEVYYWVKLQAAQRAGYSVPASVRYKDLSSEQIDYVTYAYYASILTVKYDVAVNPIDLKAALLSGEKNVNVPRLVLKSMLDNVSVSYSDNESMRSLFNKAAGEGFFKLDDEFYTDIYTYNVYVPADCKKIWITCFPVAQQLENGSDDYVSTYINGVPVKTNSTNSADISGNNSKVTVDIVYSKNNDKATYVFNVIKTEEAGEMNRAPSVKLSDPVSGLAASLSNIINSASANNDFANSSSEGFTFASSLTTYPADEQQSPLFPNYESNIETYPTDNNGNILTTNNPLETNPSEEETASVLDNVAETVRENPVVVAAPAGLLAVGASAGFMFYRKRKDEDGSIEEE